MSNIKLEDDKNCFVCGNKNSYGLQLRFTIDKDNAMHTEFMPQKHHQGFKDIVHGGLIGLILDEIMVNLAWKMGKNVVTAEFNVRLKRIAKVREKLLFRGWIDREDNKIIYTKAEAKNEHGTIIALASAKCFKVKEQFR
jgi:acyl-coenzyme A thioesterase PaaI-like protein